ncbi:YdcF family protein [Candidatus Daviesbacteria bacterium]|nr:YdcF family protein [Candidatus Daviesbacteria bacterium]
MERLSRRTLFKLTAAGTILGVTLPHIARNYLALASVDGQIGSSPKEADFDVIATLGAGSARKNNKVEAEPDFVGKMRAIAAAEAYRQGLAQNLVFLGGRVDPLSPSAAGVMQTFLGRKYLAAEGAFSQIPLPAIVVEERSQHTDTNIIELARLAREYEWRKILLLTSRYHMRAALYLTESFGLKVTPLLAEDVLLSRDGRFKPVIARFSHSEELQVRKRKEMLRLAYLMFDRQAIFRRFLAQYLGV